MSLSIRWLLWMALLVAAGVAVRAENEWPQFRGPFGNGHATASSRPPLHWSESEHVAWKTPVHGKGWSSPVISGAQIWITTASEDGHELFAVCLDRATGRVVRDLKVFQVANPQFCHAFNSYASPTPVVEANHVYVTFGSPGTACLETATGKVLWQRTDFVCNHYRGAGSSPILFEDVLILQFDGSDHQFVVALDKATGQTRWETKRSVDFQDLTPDGTPQAEGDFRKAFATPHVAMIEGRPVLISIGAKAAYGYDPRTGREIWKVVERGQHSASTRPVYAEGLIVYPTGFSKGQLLAVRPGGSGDITSTHVAWRQKRSVPNKPSILTHEGLITMIDDNGIASCLDAHTGEVLWSERVGGNYSASPILADGRIYFCSEEGKTAVIRAGRQYELLAQNQLDEGFMASPAVADNALVLRTRSHLYCVEAPQAR